LHAVVAEESDILTNFRDEQIRVSITSL